ncbi:MAG: hypothetical protein V3V62_00955 [bacterium]
MARMIDLIKNSPVDPEEDLPGRRPRQRAAPQEEVPAAPPEEDLEEPLQLLPPGAMEGGAPAEAREAAPPPQSAPGERQRSHFFDSPEQETAPAAEKPRRSVLEDSVSLQGPGDSLRTPNKLDAASRHCPYLGGKKDPKQAKDLPSSTNVCYAKSSVEKKLLRTITLPYSIIAAQRQRENCLSSYIRCPLYQAKERKTKKS